MRETIGVVYVMTNARLPGGRKIGRTVKGADRRAAQVTREYGTIDRFVVESKHVVHNPTLVEALAHDLLKRRRVKNTEIFMVNKETARQAVLTAASRAMEKGLVQRLRLCLLRARVRPVPYGYSRSRSSSWGLIAALSLFGCIGVLARCKPALPTWLPPQVYNAAALIERIG